MFHYFNLADLQGKQKQNKQKTTAKPLAFIGFPVLIFTMSGGKNGKRERGL